MVYKVEKLNKKMKIKEKQRKGLWSPEEDEKLRNYVLKHGHGCWTSLPLQAGIQRNGKSCRLRWVNYLRPGLKKGLFTKDEESTLLYLHSILGNKWSQISQHLPGRTDNEVKNYWHSYLKKKINLTIPKITNSQSLSQENSLEILHNNNEESSIINGEKRIKSQILKLSPKLVFTEWLDSSLVMDQSSQNSNYVQDFGEETTKISYPIYSEINYMEDIVQNTNFMLDEGISEIEFCSSFSDSFLFNGMNMINEQQPM